MKGFETQLLQFMTGADNRFAIPVYQRKYDWRIENCKQLYDDLVKVVKNHRNNHFFGSIVSEYNPDGYKNERVIIDGQQRLTTVSILLLAVHNLIVEGKLSTENAYLKDKIMEEYLIDKYDSSDKKIKLIPVKDDREALNRLFDVKSEKISYSNLTINYQYFYDRLQLKEISVDEIFDAINKLQIINMTLNSDDNAQLIFESLNSTGKDLSESDKIRNYVLMGLSPKEQENLYSNYWNKIEKLTGEDLDMFCRDYLSVKTKSIPSISKIYPAFKEYVEEGQLRIEGLLEDLYSYARNYKKLLAAETDSISINGCIDRLNRLETTIARPFLLEILRYYDEKKITLPDLEIIFQLIENYVFRRIVCDIPTNALNKIFLTLNNDVVKMENSADNYVEKLKYILSNKKDSGRFPDDTEFINELSVKDFYHIRSKNRSYLFERLENHDTKETKDVYKHLETGVYSIEHIMPQHLTPKWIEDLGENYEDIHDTWLHRLANLTLTAYNSNYSNESFERKKNMTNGFLDSGIRMNQKIAQNEKWGEDELEARNDDLCIKALDIWQYPDTDYIPPVKELDAVTLDDDADLSGKKIERFRFDNTELPVESWIDMYEKMVKILYEKDKSIIRKIASSEDEQYISNNKGQLRVPAEIDDDVYLEKHGNTESKITNLLKLFRLYGLEPYDLVFYLKDEDEKVEEDQKQMHKTRRAYWTYSLPIIQEATKESGAFSKVHPGKQNWLSGWFGISGCSINVIAKTNGARTEIYFGKYDTAKNKQYYDLVFKHKDEIEEKLSQCLIWDRGGDNKYARIYLINEDVSIENTNDWNAMAEFHAKWSSLFIDTIVPILKKELNLDAN